MTPPAHSPPPPAEPSAEAAPEVASEVASEAKAAAKAPRAEVEQVSRRQFLHLFGAVLLPMFMAASDQTLLATSTPIIAAEFGQLHDTAWLVTAYLLTNAIMIPVYGRLGDRYGRREVLFIGMGIFVLGGIVCAAAQSMGWLIAGRALQGLGGGGLMTLSQAMIAELVPPSQRVRFQGYFAIVFTSANILGPVIGGFTVAHASWRWLFAAQVPLALFASWRLSKLPRGRAHPDSPGVSDVAGLVMFSVTIAMLLFGLSSAGHRFAWLSLWTAILFAGTALVGTILLRHERRLAAPFFPVELFKLRPIRISVFTVICNSACRTAIIFYFPLYLQVGLHMGAGPAGAMLLPIMAGMLAAQQASTRVGLRMGKLHLMPAVGQAVAVVGLIGLALSPPTKALLMTFGCIVGIGLGPAMPCTQFIVQSVAGPARLGASTALTMLSRTTGSALGAAAAGALIYGLLPDLNIHDLVDASETLAGEEILRVFHIQFASLALVAAAAMINALGMPKVRIQ